MDRLTPDGLPLYEEAGEGVKLARRRTLNRVEFDGEMPDDGVLEVLLFPESYTELGVRMGLAGVGVLLSGIEFNMEADGEGGTIEGAG